MKRVEHVVMDELGLHARSAGLLVKLAKEFQATVTIECGEKSASAKGIFDVMRLGVKYADAVTFTIEGPDEEEAAAALEQFLKSNC